MKWRLFRLDWKYAIGELLIVTLGVLVALYVDQWNTDRLLKLEEVDYIERLLEQAKFDLDSIERI